MVMPYTGKMYAREMLKNFTRSQRARKAYYLYSERAACIGSREVKGNNIEDKRKQLRTEFIFSRRIESDVIRENVKCGKSNSESKKKTGTKEE